MEFMRVYSDVHTRGYWYSFKLLLQEVRIARRYGGKVTVCAYDNACFGGRKVVRVYDYTSK